MRRRDFIALIAGASGWPLGARAQQASIPVVGFMSGRAPEDSADLVTAFRQGMAESGFVDGQNVTIEFRWANGDYDRLPALVADLVNRKVANDDNPGRVRDGWRPGQDRHCRELQSARW
jgi:putative tryptophan/tyrosine transport system substrate-binding protein